MTSPLDRLALACPHDGQALRRDERTLRCPAGHTFDIARQGHANVLPVGHKASRDPGDGPAMIQARRAVLDSGFLAPLRDELVEHPVVRELAESEATMLDAGCGEGYYTAALAERAPHSAVLGIDISKHAIKAAAQRHRRVAWLVASNRQLPIAPGHADLIVSLFGFACWRSWASHQRAGQRVLCVDPGPRHLIELRECIYPEVRLHAPPSHAEAIEAGYRLQDERSVCVQRGEVPIDALLAMTPHGHRASGQARDRLVSHPPTSMRVEVVLRTYRLGR